MKTNSKFDTYRVLARVFERLGEKYDHEPSFEAAKELRKMIMIQFMLDTTAGCLRKKSKMH